MSTAKRLVLSLAGRKDSQHTPGASSTRLVGNSLSPGHELDEIAIVSHGGTDTCGRVSYGSLSLNGPRYIPGECRCCIGLSLSIPTLLYLRCFALVRLSIDDDVEWFISKLSVTIPLVKCPGQWCFFLFLASNESFQHTLCDDGTIRHDYCCFIFCCCCVIMLDFVVHIAVSVRALLDGSLTQLLSKYQHIRSRFCVRCDKVFFVGHPSPISFCRRRHRSLSLPSRRWRVYLVFSHLWFDGSGLIKLYVIA